MEHKFVACMCDHKWWIEIVKQKSDEQDDNVMTFMPPSGLAKHYYWPVSKISAGLQIVAFCVLWKYRPSHRQL